MKNFYAVLGITQNATSLEVKKAYRINAVKFHPDKHFGNIEYTQKFIEIKEAYDVLIDDQKREIYDKEYFTYLKDVSHSQNTYQTSNTENTNKKEAFKHEFFERYFNANERNTQETPQEHPSITPWGELILGKYVLFTLPKNIGKLISGWSSLKDNIKPISSFQLLKSILKSSILSFSVIGIILFIIWHHWYFNLHDLDATRKISITYLVLITIIISLKYLVRHNEIVFKHINYFLGVNGFSLHIAGGQNLDVYGNLEINFNDVTDLINVTTIHNLNFQYSKTEYEFIWLNKINSKPLYKVKNQHNSKESNPDKDIHFDYWLNYEAEKLWTIYLLDKLEKTIETIGYLEFNLYSFEKNILIPYIRIGIGFITFLLGNQEITYNFNDIKRVYTKGTDLYIEHKNYQKRLFIFESGDKNYIPLTNLSNRKFFLKSIELLLGYDIV